MKIELGIGKSVQAVEIPDQNIIKILHANDSGATKTGEEVVTEALENPIGKPRLREIVKPGEKVVIVTSDITRPMPTSVVMPLILDELYAAGAKPEDLSLVFAVGSHRSHTPEEKKKLAGERVYNEIRCVDSSEFDFVKMGKTSKGTPVDISRIVAEADRRICLGNIEYHYFAGYSGGIKAIMPGASTPEAIQVNHKMMLSDDAHAGKLDGNPLREDLEEAKSMIDADFILNVVLDEKKQIVHAVAGDLAKAHRQGCKLLDELYQVTIPEKADIVITSQGGAPKDLNLYQTQKALDNAKHAVKDGGTIILVGSCKEGLGQKIFSEWMNEAQKPEELTERIKKEFKLGGHKAAAIAMVLEKASIYLVSEMDDELVRNVFMKPFNSVQEAFDAAMKKHGNEAKVTVMPYGGSTLPKLER